MPLRQLGNADHSVIVIAPSSETSDSVPETIIIHGLTVQIHIVSYFELAEGAAYHYLQGLQLPACKRLQRTFVPAQCARSGSTAVSVESGFWR